MPQIPVSIADPNVQFVPGNVRYTADQFGAPIAEGLGEVGKTIDRVERRNAAAYAAKTGSDFQLEQLKGFNDAQLSTTDPEGFTDNYLSNFDDSAQKLIDSAPNQYAKNALTERIATFRNHMARQSIGFEAQQKQASRLSDLNDSATNYQTMVAEDPTQLNEALAQWGADIVGAQGTMILSKNNSVLDKGREAIIKSAASNQLYKDPVAFKQQLNDGTYDEALGKDKQKWETLADKRQRYLSKQTDYAITAAPIQAQADIHDKLVAGNLGISDIQNNPHLDDQQKQVYTEQLLFGSSQKNPSITQDQKEIKLSDLTSKYLGLKDTLNKNDPNPDDLGQITKFNNEVTQAMAQGYVTKTDVHSMLQYSGKQAVNSARADATAGSLNQLTQKTDVGESTIDSWLARNQISNPAFKNSVYKTYWAGMQNGKVDDIAVNSPDDAAKKLQMTNKVAQQAIDFTIRQRFPQYSQYETLPNAVISGAQKVSVNPNPNNAETTGSISAPAIPEGAVVPPKEAPAGATFAAYRGGKNYFKLPNGKFWTPD